MCTLSLLHVVFPLPGALCPLISIWLDSSHCSVLNPNNTSFKKPSLIILSCISILLSHSLPCISVSPSPSVLTVIIFILVWIAYMLVNYLPPLQNVSSCRVEPLSVFFMAVFPVPRIVIGTELGLHNCMFSEWMNEWLKGFHYLGSVLKSRDITLLTKVHMVKAMIFPLVMYGCESWTIKNTECWRTDAFKLCWRRLLKVSWTARRSNQSILKELNPEYSLEGLMLKWKLQYFGNLMGRLIGKDPDSGKDWGQEEKGVTEDEMVG